MTISILQDRIDTDPEFRSFVRARSGNRGTTCPIRVVGGVGGPRIAGEGFYYTTPSGLTRVNHPNAYGWRTVYHASTLRIEVSIGWLRRVRPSLAAQVADDFCPLCPNNQHGAGYSCHGA